MTGCDPDLDTLLTALCVEIGGHVILSGRCLAASFAPISPYAPSPAFPGSGRPARDRYGRNVSFGVAGG